MNPESSLPDPLANRLADRLADRLAEPPAVVIHSLADARLVLDASGALPVMLLSAPDAACFMGAAWWLALVHAAAAGRPGAVMDLLDCGDAAGWAMQALRLGQKRLIIDPTCPQLGAVLERAATTGAIIGTVRPPSLDLARHGAARKLHAWLAGRSE